VQSHDLLELFRREMSDEADEFLWSDPDVYGYMDDAQKMFCRLTDGIGDATTVDLTQIAVEVDDEWLDLSPLILKIRSAYVISTGTPLEVVNEEDILARGLRFDGSTGPIRRLIVGVEEDKVRVNPKASVADTIQLSVFRLPATDIDDEAQAFEIPAQHVRHLLLWMKHLAFGKVDADTFNAAKSIGYETKFRDYCAAAKTEQQKKRHKVRTVAYGGI
jgi:hypothetical protein